MRSNINISLSVVSHGQFALVEKLLFDLDLHCKGESIELILTLNMADEAAPNLGNYAFPIVLLRNSSPKGFGANHNTAFAQSQGQFFCVLNPDIRITSNPFPALKTALAIPNVGVAAPVVLGRDGAQEDNARNFPTPWAIVKRLLTGRHAAVYVEQGVLRRPDWVGGMCMLFSRKLFESVQGFDERFFLYYEDVDLCARLKLQGWHAVLCAAAMVTHEAQRSSHKNLRYLGWHVRSMLRFFCSSTFTSLWRRGYL